MNCSPKAPEPPFTAGGGADALISSEQDPYRVLDELMVVIEALCPIWPERETTISSGPMLL